MNIGSQANDEKMTIDDFSTRLHRALGRNIIAHMNEGALDTLDIPSALQRIASGTLSKTIAAEFGVTSWAVRKRLAKFAPIDYAEAIKNQAESFVEAAMAYVETCDVDTVAIARVRVDSAFKYAAARDPERWGPRQTVTIDIGGNLAEALARSRERLIEGAVVSEQHAAQIEEKP